MLSDDIQLFSILSNVSFVNLFVNAMFLVLLPGYFFQAIRTLFYYNINNFMDSYAM